MVKTLSVSTPVLSHRPSMTPQVSVSLMPAKVWLCPFRSKCPQALGL